MDIIVYTPELEKKLQNLNREVAVSVPPETVTMFGRRLATKLARRKGEKVLAADFVRACDLEFLLMRSWERRPGQPKKFTIPPGSVETLKLHADAIIQQLFSDDPSFSEKVISKLNESLGPVAA